MKTKKYDLVKTEPGISIRTFRTTDLDFVISRQLALYAAEYGLTSETWIAYLTGGVQDFAHRFDRERDCMYILEKNGIPSGCIAITHADAADAQLRFYFLEPYARGAGAGHQLIDLAIRFCKEKNYRRIFLWTFSTLLAARHLYAGKGFRITGTHVNNDWGEPILEERWELVV